MTIKEIFAHLVSFRWQRNALLALLAVGFALDAIMGNFADPDYAVKATAGFIEGFALINVGWAFIKACIAFPELAMWFGICSLFDN